MKWTFLDTGFRSAAFNMDTDVRLAEALRDGTGLPTLRVYGWEPHAISLGAHQRYEDFDARRLASAHVDIVRRPTGGRAILHAHELTYSVVTEMNGRSLRELYGFING